MSNIVFSDGTIYSKSKVDMVNECLMSIGEVPLDEDTLIDSLPSGSDADIARRVVENVMVEVQSRGWYFNIDYAYPLLPDSNNTIALPANILRVDFGNTEFRHQYNMKNNQIYDYVNLTFIITIPLYADVLYLSDYDELPVEAYEYISLRAARKFQQRVIGSTELAGFTQLDEVDALTNLHRANLQAQDFNIQNSRVSTRIHNGYLTPAMYNSKGRR